MRGLLPIAFVVALASFAASASAVDLGGTTVVIPVAMHGPGKLGTVWVTDVWIGNHSSVAKTVNLEFYPTGGGSLSASVQVGTYAAVEIKDIVLGTFGLSNAKGLLILSVEGGSAFVAQARIYNTGNPAGEFGQFVPGIGLQMLRRQAWVYGVSGVSGNRTNVGVANPTDTTFDVSVSLSDADGGSQTGRTISLSPKQLVQIDDIFSYLGVSPGSNMQVEISSPTSEDRIYGYASVVRDDTGDAIFLPGQAPNF